MCCLLFFLTTLALGIFIATYATQCGKRTSDNVYYSAPAANITHLSFTSDGDVTFTRSVIKSNANFSILVSRSAASQSELNKFTTTFQDVDDTLTVTSEVPKSFDTFWQNLYRCQSVSIEVQLPYYMDEETTIQVTATNSEVSLNFIEPILFKSVYVSSTNGKVEMDKVQSETSFQIQSTNGDIKLGSISANSFRGQTTNGKVDLGTLWAHSVTAQTTNGKIVSTLVTLNGTGSSIQAQTTNGDIEFTKVIATSGSDITLSSTNGDLAMLLNSFNGNFDAHTTGSAGVDISGSDISYTTNDRSEKQGKVGSGMGNLNFGTTNAKITLEFN